MMSQSDPSDADDVRLALHGDREAFGRLYDRHARAVRAVVGAVSGDFGAVEDLTQETFLRGYRRLATLHDGAGFRRWIQGVARFVARERRRELGRDRHRFEAANNQAAPAVEAHGMIERDDEQRRVLSALAELPERERLVVHAYFFQEQNVNEAAAVMGMSRSGFYVALQRAMDRLRKRLGVTSSSNTSRER